MYTPNPIRVDRQQRDALHRTAHTYLTGVGDIELALRTDPYEARKLAETFARFFILLDDLGWDHDDPRDSFEIRMNREALRQLASHCEQHVRDGLPCVNGDLDDALDELNAWKTILALTAAPKRPSARAPCTTARAAQIRLA